MITCTALEDEDSSMDTVFSMYNTAPTSVAFIHERQISVLNNIDMAPNLTQYNLFFIL